jgi:hypothetical protein
LSTRSVPGRPQRAKARRSSAWLACGGTFSHLPWGENGRAQHGAAALIDQPQPADALAGLQRHQLGGVDLPDRVRRRGPAEVRRPAAAGGGRAEPGLVEPAPEGALAGDRVAGAVAPQQDAQQAEAPGGVVAAQGHAEVAEGVGGRGGVPRVARRQRGGAAVAQAAAEVADAAGGQAQRGGDGGGRLALLGLPPGGEAERQRDRGRHDETSGIGAGVAETETAVVVGRGKT